MKVLEYLYKIEEFATILLFIVVSIIIFSHVVARYIFKSPFYFTEEISKYCFIWMVMICASICIRRGSHTQVNYFTSFLPPKVLPVLGILRNIGILIFLGYLIYYGIFLSIKTMDVRTAALALPWGLVYLSAPACAVFMSIHTVKLVLNDIQILFEKKRSPSKETS